MNRIVRAVAGLLIPLIASSCNGPRVIIIDKDGDNSGHNCSIVGNNGYWESLGFDLYHNDPSSCPREIVPYTYVQAGGLIIHRVNGWPDGAGVATTALLTIFATNAACQEEAFGEPLAQQEEAFRGGDFLQDGRQWWGTQLWTTFQAGTGYDQNHDCPVFAVSVRGYNAMPEVVTKIQYWPEAM